MVDITAERGVLMYISWCIALLLLPLAKFQGTIYPVTDEESSLLLDCSKHCKNQRVQLIYL